MDKLFTMKVNNELLNILKKLSKNKNRNMSNYVKDLIIHEYQKITIN